MLRGIPLTAPCPHPHRKCTARAAGQQPELATVNLKRSRRFMTLAIEDPSWSVTSLSSRPSRSQITTPGKRLINAGKGSFRRRTAGLVAGNSPPPRSHSRCRVWTARTASPWSTYGHQSTTSAAWSDRTFTPVVGHFRAPPAQVRMSGRSTPSMADTTAAPRKEPLRQTARSLIDPPPPPGVVQRVFESNWRPTTEHSAVSARCIVLVGFMSPNATS